MPMVNETHQSIDQICATPTHATHRIKNRLNAFKAKDTNDSVTLSDSDTQRETTTHSNTLPFRKARKKIDNGAKSIGSNQTTSRVNVQNVFSSTQNMSINRIDTNRQNDNVAGCSANNFLHKKLKNPSNNGVDNSGFQSLEDDRQLKMNMQNNYANDLDQSIGNRDTFIRTRLQLSNREYDKLNAFNSNLQQLPLAAAALRNHNHNSQSLPKDLTRYSICSAESEKTDYTDLSPMTPSTPYANKDPNAIGSSIQREQQHHQQSTHSKFYKDLSEASCSNANSNNTSMMYNTQAHRYYDTTECKRENLINNMRPKNLPEIHLRPVIQHSNHMPSNHMSSVVDTGASSLDNLNTSTSTLYQKFERRNVYQRPNYSFSNAHNTTSSHHSHNNNMKHNNINNISTIATPKKRNIYATQSLGTNANVTEMNIDLVRLTNIRKTNSKDDLDKSKEERAAFDIHSKTLHESEWSEHNNSDRRL